MTIEFPKNRKQITDRIKNDVRAELGKNSNPFLRNSALASLIFGMAGRIFDFFSQLKFLLINLFPDTATGSFLERWGSYVKINRLPASTANGNISINGDINASPIIPNGTQFQSSSQVQYTSIGTAIIIEQTIGVTEITRIQEIVTVKTTAPHPFAAGLVIKIEGADQTEYNGTFTIKSVPDPDLFTYDITGTPVTPATGTTITSSAEMAQVVLESVDFGTAGNLDQGEAVSLLAPIGGIDNQGFVQFEGIIGGTNEEADASFRARILDRYQNPVSFFNVAQIEQKVKTVPDVTRVFVQSITPAPGQVTIFFVKDNTQNIIPSLADRQAAKIKVFEIKPAHVDGGPITPPSTFDPGLGDIIFPPLFIQLVDFVFTALSPDTPSLRDAIQQNLDQLFRSGNNVGENISSFTYNCVIKDSFDSAGTQVKDFALQAPAGDIIVGPSEIAVLGNVIFQIVT